MALEDFRADMERCTRCSYCKWIPFDQVKSWRFASGCPSIDYGKFQAYSAGGRLAVALSFLDGRSSYTDRFLDIVYKCQMDGLCDISDKICRYNMEPLQVMRELRFKLVEDGQLLPQHMFIIDHLRKEDNMMLAKKADRGRWAKGLDVKNINEDKVEVYFHAGCRYSFDEELWPVARAAINLLKKAGVDIAIAGKDESCCGGRAYELGYKGELIKYAENNVEMLKTNGIKTVVTPCSDCYHAFKVLYHKMDKQGNFEVLHITEYLDRLIKEGKLSLTKKIPMTITYHDPCHLGRLGEAYIPWKGVEKKIFGQMVVYDPPKPRYIGARGIYEPPREILRNIPGLKVVEMPRNREYAWCCGAGGGVIDAYPEYANWTARERIEEAKSTGAEAIVTACPWCERNFIDSITESHQQIKVYDILELVQQAI